MLSRQTKELDFALVCYPVKFFCFNGLPCHALQNYVSRRGDAKKVNLKSSMCRLFLFLTIMRICTNLGRKYCFQLLFISRICSLWNAKIKPYKCAEKSVGGGVQTVGAFCAFSFF